jgi:hypothetical protein
MNMRLMLIASALFCLATPGHAADGDYQAVGDKKEITLDPSQSYLIVQTSSASSMFSFPVTFVRRPEKEDIDDYVRRRGEALEKVHEKWQRKHATWQKDMERWDGMSPSTRAREKKPIEPEEPTDQNLAFPSLDQEGMVQIGPFDRFSKKDGRSTFLHRVKPGRYAFYGPVVFANAVGGSCMCMGSIEFDIAPGKIVNGGMMKLNWMEERQKAKDEGRPLPKTEFDIPEHLTSISWEVPVDGAAIDPRLSDYKILAADLHATSGFPNYFGLVIDRVTAIPGILEYERDRVIDPKSATATYPPAALKASTLE